MTELEKMQRAKMYLDKLANGINPIDDTVAADEDIINNVRLSRCFFYISDILQQVIENGGIIQKAKSTPLPPFFLTEEQRKQYVPSGRPMAVSDIVKVLNELTEPEQCKTLSASRITEWLVHLGVLEVREDSNGKKKKYPTPQGGELGITMETRNGMYGEYTVVLYNKSAQQFIADNLEAMMDFKNEKSENAAGNQGQAWTPAHEECLVELFHKNVPVSEIAVTLMRTETAIRARLEKMGLIEKRSDV